MKPLLSFLLLAAIGIADNAAAQTKNSTTDLMRLTEEIANTVFKRSSENGDAIVSADGANRLLKQFDTDKTLQQKKEKLYGTAYSSPIVFQPQPGETDRITWLRNIPQPKMPEPAWQTDRKIYDEYVEKVQSHLKELQSRSAALVNTTEDAQLYNQGGEAALKKKYANKANQNEMIAAMGGVENMQKMTEEQRQQAANKMVADMTGGLTPEQIRNMTPEQQRALAMKMAAKSQQQPAAKRAVNTGDQQEAQEIMQIEKWRAEFYEEMKNLTEPISKLSAAYEKESSDKTSAIAQWAASIIATLPEVADSEYGKRKVGEEYVIYTEHLLQYYAGREDIIRRIGIWEKMVRVHVTMFKKLDDFEATYSNRKDLSDRMKTTLAGVLQGGYDAIIELTKQADLITGMAAGKQGDFNCHIRKDCGDAKK